MNLYELRTARQRGFLINQINDYKIKNYSNRSHINIHSYLNLRLPKMHRQFFKILSQNPEYVPTQCKKRNYPFLFTCRRWYLQYNHTYSNTNFSIIFQILV